MENLLFQHEQLRGWGDNDQTQTYNSLYTRLNFAKKQNLSVQNKVAASLKLPQKASSNLSSKYNLNYKHHPKPITQVKFRGSCQLQNEKQKLLKYLQNQSEKNQLKSHGINLQTLASALNCRNQAQSLTNQLNLSKKSKQIVAFSNLQTPIEQTSINELFNKLPNGLTIKKKQILIKGKHEKEHKCLQTKKKNYRSYYATSCSKMKDLKKENSRFYDNPHRGQKKSQELSSKIKPFPLFFRQIQWRENNHQYQQKTKNQLNLQKKKSSFQLSTRFFQKQHSLGQFIDSKIFYYNLCV